MPIPDHVSPPPERFNIAAHLLAANAGRHAKAAFVDDRGALSFGQLDERARRMAAALRGAQAQLSCPVLSSPDCAVLALKKRMHHV